MVIDASSLVHGWDNYPIENFPRFWNWIQSQFDSSSLLISQVAYDEIRHVSSDCYQWLTDIGVSHVAVTGDIITNALAINETIGISGDNYHPNGVDENDIFIIATAMSLQCDLISNESRQPKLPKDRRRMKIPAVCLQPTVNVKCINFVEYIQQSQKTF